LALTNQVGVANTSSISQVGVGQVAIVNQ